MLVLFGILTNISNFFEKKSRVFSIFAFCMEGKVKLQMVMATFGSSALGKFKVGYLNMGTSEVLSSKSSHRDDFMHLIASI